MNILKKIEALILKFKIWKNNWQDPARENILEEEMLKYYREWKIGKIGFDELCKKRDELSRKLYTFARLKKISD